jgi:LuxR family maltose regulon positive regulatory protein
MLEPHVVVTKFTIPPLRPHLLPRPSLIERLNQGCKLPLVLLSASAGSGKTTLLAAWASQCPHPVAWLSLDSLDNDPLRFWSTIMLALRTRFPSLGEEAFTSLHSSDSSNLSAFLTLLINDLSTVGEETTLIVDDYHVIEEPTIHSSLTFLLNHAPSCLHLLLSSRIDPSLALSRHRARGQMIELRDADLRLSEPEVADFLQQVMGLHLDTVDEQRLAQRTEGWLVGLQLAALSLTRQDDPSAWVVAFRGNQRLILDYLQDEILMRQEPSIRRFLLRVCILPRMNASLCQAVTGKAGSQQMLEALERSNLFLVPLDEQRQWYRLHDLFRDALLARLQAIQPELMPTLYERASRWYEHHGLLPEAIDASLKAGAFAHAANLIERSIDPKSLRHPYHTLCRWLEQMPIEMMQAQPVLSFLYALAIMYTSLRLDPASWERIDRFLRWAEEGFEASTQQDRLGDALELHAELAFFREDIPAMFTLARQASSLLSAGNLMYSTNLLTRGYEHLLAGNVDAAWHNCLEGNRLCESRGNYTAALAASNFLGEICFARGELHRASDYYHQTLVRANEDAEVFQHQFVTGTGDREPFFVSWAYHNLAQLSYEWNDLEVAHQYLSQARASGEDPETGMHVLTSGSLIQARLLLRRGESAQAQRVLETWERQARFPWVRRAIRTGQARLQLALGNLPAVEQWSRARDQPLPSGEQEGELPYMSQEEEALLLIRLYLAQRRVEEALQAVIPWKEKAQAQGRQHSVLEILILESLACSMAHQMPQARSALIHALRLAHPQNYQRLFLDEGQTLATLLRSTLEEMQEPDVSAYARRLLKAFEQEQVQVSFPGTSAPSQLLEPLTPQEQRVLRLMAEGASNQQIANQLVISLATARKHVSNILSKLGAANRTQAIALARQYALL